MPGLLRGALGLRLTALLHGVEGILQRRSSSLRFLDFAPLAHQLVDRWQVVTPSHKSPGHSPRDACPTSQGGWSSIQFRPRRNWPDVLRLSEWDFTKGPKGRQAREAQALSVAHPNIYVNSAAAGLRDRIERSGGLVRQPLLQY